jgi:hypothetical protein
LSPAEEDDRRWVIKVESIRQWTKKSLPSSTYVVEPDHHEHLFHPVHPVVAREELRTSNFELVAGTD